MTRTEILSTIERINEESFKEVTAPIISVSSMNEFLGNPFDKEKVAAICEAKGKDNDDYKYAHMTKEQIIQLWETKADESRRYGKLADTYSEIINEKTPMELELWKLDNDFDGDERLRNNCLGVEEIRNNMMAKGYQYLGREIQVYARTINGNIVTGRLDIAFYDPNRNIYFIVDYKTTEDFKTSNRDKLAGPMKDFDDCDLIKYTLQTQIYKKAFVETYGLTSSDRVITLICNLLRQPGVDGRHYKCYTEGMPYNSIKIDSAVDFAIKKRNLIRALNK